MSSQRSNLNNRVQPGITRAVARVCLRNVIALVSNAVIESWLGEALDGLQAYTRGTKLTQNVCFTCSFLSATLLS